MKSEIKNDLEILIITKFNAFFLPLDSIVCEWDHFIFYNK